MSELDRPGIAMSQIVETLEDLSKERNRYAGKKEIVRQRAGFKARTDHSTQNE